MPPLVRWFAARRTRQALPEALRARVRALPSWRRIRRAARQPLALTRFVALDLETTGPRMLVDRIISIGAIGVVGNVVRHADAYHALLRQEAASSHDNILVHQIGGQQQLAGNEPRTALLGLLEHLGDGVAVAFRAEFDATVLARELHERLGLRLRTRFLDLAVVLPALFPWTDNDSLDDWLVHLGLPPVGRHDAVADAYASAQLLLVALAAARRVGIEDTAALLDLERAQRWLGRRR